MHGKPNALGSWLQPFVRELDSPTVLQIYNYQIRSYATWFRPKRKLMEHMQVRVLSSGPILGYNNMMETKSAICCFSNDGVSCENVATWIMGSWAACDKHAKPFVFYDVVFQQNFSPWGTSYRISDVTPESNKCTVNQVV